MSSSSTAWRLPPTEFSSLPLNLREVIERDAGAQAFDHSSRDDEQRLGQIIEFIPIPALALFRLHQSRFAAGRLANEIDVDVMPLAVFAVKNVIADRQQSQIGDLQSGLFLNFAAGGQFEALAEFDVAAGRGVIPGAMRPAPATQQD